MIEHKTTEYKLHIILLYISFTIFTIDTSMSCRYTDRKHCCSISDNTTKNVEVLGVFSYNITIS